MNACIAVEVTHIVIIELSIVTSNIQVIIAVFRMRTVKQ